MSSSRVPLKTHRADKADARKTRRDSNVLPLVWWGRFPENSIFAERSCKLIDFSVGRKVQESVNPILVSCFFFSQSDMPTSSQFIRYDGTDLAPSALKEIETKIGETEYAKKKGLETLTKKLKELEDIEPCFDECFLLKFLRVESFDSSKAFERIKRYYGMQEDIIKIFNGSSISIPAVRSSEYFWAFPYRNVDNSVLVVARMGIPDFSKISFDDKCYLDLLITDHILKNPLTQMCGVSFVVDWSGFKLTSFLAFRPVTIFKLLNHMLKNPEGPELAKNDANLAISPRSRQAPSK
ncbi:clavesin-2 [Trichonephila clavipes]|nr:clavesin-2 [Trichonephila clavipes]